jgi:tetratricopeptide (TPR) repeat protein
VALQRGAVTEAQLCLQQAKSFSGVVESVPYLQASQKCERTLGDFPGALSYAQKLLAVRQAEGVGVAEALLEVAGCYTRLRNFGNAETAYREAIAMLSEPKSLEAAWTNLAVLQADQAKMTDAVESFRKAASLAEKRVEADAATRLPLWNGLAAALLSLKDMAGAANAVKQAVEAATSLEVYHPLRASVTMNAALLARAQNNLPQARMLGRQASAESLAWLEHTLAGGNTEMQLLQLRRTIDAISPLVIFGEPDLPGLADTLYRSQGRILREMLSRESQVSAEGQAALQVAKDALAELEDAQGATDAATVAARRELVQLRATWLPALATPQQPALPKDAVLLTYLLVQDPGPPAVSRYGLLVQGAGAPRWFELGPASRLEALLRKLHGFLELAIAQPERSVVLDVWLADLGRLLFPAELWPRLQRCPRVLLQANGLLHFAPWAILTTEKGGPTLAQRLPLLECIAQSSALELPVPLELPLWVVPVVEAPAAGLGEPPGNLAAPLTPQLWQDLSHMLPLAGAGREAKALRQIFQKQGRASQVVTSERALREASLAGVLHFACHGFAFADEEAAEVDRWLPYRSGLVVGNVRPGLEDATISPKEDNLLYAGEISRLPLAKLPLVVISACHSGVGRPEPGEPFQGLMRAFLSAGASRVLASSQVVDDQTPELFLAKFYHKLLQERLTPAAALWQTQREWLGQSSIGASQRFATAGAWMLVGRGWEP